MQNKKKKKLYLLIPKLYNMCTTTVVNLKIQKYDVYIGREGKGQDGYFGNPILLSNLAARGSTLEQYKVYFQNRLINDVEFKRRILELKGKVLGCFCKPYPCHGDIIIEYLNNLK